MGVSVDALVATDVDGVDSGEGLMDMVGDADRAILVGGGVAVGVGERSFDFVLMDVILRI
jgi:hypothetical protein